MLLHYDLTSMVYEEKSLFLYVIYLFFNLATIKIFFLLLVFSNENMICLDCLFLNTKHIIFLNISSFHLWYSYYLSAFWNCNYMYIKLFDIVLQLFNVHIFFCLLFSLSLN